MNRRNFLALSPGLILLNQLLANNKSIPLGLQLYTLRDLVDLDLAKVLAKISKIGYTNIELYPLAQGNFFGLEPATCGKIMLDNGLKVPSIHIRYQSEFDGKAARTASVLAGLETLLDGAKQIGTKFVVLPYITKELRTSADDYKKVADNLNKAGALAKERGLTFGYHNHSFEFDSLPGSPETGYQILLANTDSKLVSFELDIYWALKAKQDVAKLFSQSPGRFPLWHVKDIGPEPAGETYPVGKGSVDWKAIFAKAQTPGLQMAFIEQDNHPTGEPYANIAESLAYLTKLTK